MTIQAIDAVRVYRHPVESEDRSDEDEEPRWWPIQDDRRRYLRPLVTDGSPEDPDVFDVRERLPLEFVGDDASYASRRAKAIEQDLIDSIGSFRRAPDDEEADEE